MVAAGIEGAQRQVGRIFRQQDDIDDWCVTGDIEREQTSDDFEGWPGVQRDGFSLTLKRDIGCKSVPFVDLVFL